MYKHVQVFCIRTLVFTSFLIFLNEASAESLLYDSNHTECNISAAITSIEESETVIKHFIIQINWIGVKRLLKAPNLEYTFTESCKDIKVGDELTVYGYLSHKIKDGSIINAKLSAAVSSYGSIKGHYIYNITTSLGFSWFSLPSGILKKK